MKKFRKLFLISLSTIIVVCGVLVLLLQPVIAIGRHSDYTGNNRFNWKKTVIDPSKKTVIIIADNKVTEIFDMLAPFYLFNATGRLNVYIVANERAPVKIKKDLSVYRN